jgi:DNA-binding XRE family transcriptional regulator
MPARSADSLGDFGRGRHDLSGRLPNKETGSIHVAKKKRMAIDCKRVELDGVRYVIVRETLFDRLCQHAGVDAAQNTSSADGATTDLVMDRTSLAAKLIRRRKATGLSQAELARRAGIRPETLNRIERGRTTPDFATVRKLVIAMHAAEMEQTL